MSLEKIRNEIDSIDTELATLLKGEWNVLRKWQI